MKYVYKGQNHTYLGATYSCFPGNSLLEHRVTSQQSTKLKATVFPFMLHTSLLNHDVISEMYYWMLLVTSV